MQTLPKPRAIELTPLLTDPHPHHALTELRREAPLFKCGPGGQFAVTRHADVSRLLKDRRVGHHVPLPLLQVPFGRGPSADFRFNSILNRDAPDHTRLRRLMSQAFSRSLVLRMREWITGMVDDLLAPLLDGEPFDVVDDLAFPLPSQVICELLGIPAADRDAVRDEGIRFAGVSIDEQDQAITWLRGYIGRILEERGADPDGDLLQRMLAAADGDDALSYAEIVDNAAMLFVAGYETTKHLIAAGCSALLEHPSQRARLWSEPALSVPAVEEMLRFDGGVQLVVVRAREPLEVGGTLLREGAVLYLLLNSANRDGAVFDDPERLDITRDPNPHVGFGGGLHLCLGAILARLEGDVVLRRLAETTRSIELAGDIVRLGSGLGAFDSVPIVAAAR